VYDLLGNHLTQDHDGTEFAGLFNDVNEQTKRDGNDLAWDLRGNLTEDDEGQQYDYDRSNMLTEVRDDSNNLIATYAYDALGRRIEKDVDGVGVLHFYYDGQRMIEERDDSGDVQRQNVWGGIYIDELLLFKDVIGEGGTANADYLVLRHHNFNVVALVARTSGGVVERYDYNPYGQRFVLDADYSDDADGLSDVGLAIGHQGLYHDAETGLIYNRARMLHPFIGRFMQRDPLGYIDGMSLAAAYAAIHVTTDYSGFGILITDASDYGRWDLVSTSTLSMAANYPMLGELVGGNIYRHMEEAVWRSSWSDVKTGQVLPMQRSSGLYKSRYNCKCYPAGELTFVSYDLQQQDRRRLVSTMHWTAKSDINDAFSNAASWTGLALGTISLALPDGLDIIVGGAGVAASAAAIATAPSGNVVIGDMNVKFNIKHRVYGASRWRAANLMVGNGSGSNVSQAICWECSPRDCPSGMKAGEFLWQHRYTDDELLSEADYVLNKRYGQKWKTVFRETISH
jgi:RHS repeat-associated protein